MSNYPVVRRLLDLPADWRDREIFRSSAGSLTFAGLRESMLQFAGWLNAVAGVRPGDRVAVCLPRSIAATQAIYGILAAGAAYVPLPFMGPPAQLAGILKSVRPRLVLTAAEMATRLSGESTAKFPLQVIETNPGPLDLVPLCRGIRAMASVADVGADDLAAVYFTSGSTGQPKGAMWSHRGMAATLDWVGRYRRATAEDRLVGHAGLHYSLSLDLFYPLSCGCREFLLADRETMFADRVGQVIARERATIWISSATLLRLLLEEGNLEKLDLSALRRIESIGERLAIPTLRRLMAMLPQACFVNIYGATEAFDMAHYVVPRPLPEDLAALPIGGPIGNLDVSLHDEAGVDVAPGSIGEICVSGPAVMQGYWEDPALSAARQIDGRPGTYRTGDLAFLGEDRLLHLVGRGDHMFKLRGHRIDLGEIEAALKAHPAVRDAVAFACSFSPGEDGIRAVVLANASADIESDLRKLCIERLASFARPRRISVVEKFPLLSTGKVDRRALKALTDRTSDTTVGHRQPMSGSPR